MKSTKKALTLSVLSLVLCFTMLLGTTYAWFTDSVTSGVNKIVAGNLDIDLDYTTDGTTWTPVTGNTKLFNNNALWEPGHTEVAYLRISNVGTLALKYNFAINVANEIAGTNVAGETFKLSDYIKMGVVDSWSGSVYADRAAARAAVTDAGNIATYTAAGKMLKGAAAKTFAIVVFMPEEVGNEANYMTGTTAPSIELGVELFATQDTVEKDSFNEFYDENAPYTLPLGVNAESFGDNVLCSVAADGTPTYYPTLNAALAAAPSVLYAKPGSTIAGNAHPSLMGSLTLYGNDANFNGLDIAIEEGATFTADTTLNIQDAKNIYVWGTRRSAYTFTLNINNCSNTLNGSAGRLYYVNAGSTGKNVVTITNCDFKNSESPIYGGNGGSLTVENCSFQNVQVALNINTKVGDMTTTVKNCNFVNCAADPNSAAKNYNGVIRLVNTANGTDKATVENCTFTGTALNGDILLGDTRTLSKPCYPITLTLKNTSAKIQEFNTDFAVKQTVTADTVINHLGFDGSDWTKIADGLYTDADGNYSVYSATGLAYFSNKSVEGTIKIAADIDMANATMSSISAPMNKSLTVEGNGHKISNVKLVSGTNDNTTGQASMFHSWSYSTLKISNLTLENITVVADNDDTGYGAAVVGYCEGALTLDNVDVVNASVTGAKSSGILVGHLTNTASLNAKDCDISGTVTLTDYEEGGHYAGKYIGTLAGTATITDCTANVTLSGNIKNTNVGDIFGRNLGTLN